MTELPLMSGRARAARAISILCAVAALMSACGGGGTEPATGAGVQISATESATLIARVKQIAPVHPDLAWLADSASIVLGTGAQLTPVDLSTDLAAGPFYAVALHRAFSRSTSSFATYDVIAFNDPANPTDFLIVDGWSSVSGSTPPASVTGAFGGGTATSTMNAHLFHVSGSTISSWRATSGGGTLAADTLGGACPNFQGPAGVTCAQSAMKASFQVISAASDSASVGTRHASLSTTIVNGVLLTFSLQ
ncbi:MAG TPA: hypothetical protein VF159_09765 [Gemmatimonadaceae bacterium]